MERAVMAHNRGPAERKGGFTLMGFYQLVSMLLGRLPDCGVHRLMALVWRNYFDPSSSAPPPERSWLDDIRSKPMLDAPCDGRSGSVLIERDSSGSRHAGIGAVRKPRYLWADRG